MKVKLCKMQLGQLPIGIRPDPSGLHIMPQQYQVKKYMALLVWINPEAGIEGWK